MIETKSHISRIKYKHLCEYLENFDSLHEKLYN
jgi:hypothetical protein